MDGTQECMMRKGEGVNWDDQREMLLAGPKMHSLHGYIEEAHILKQKQILIKDRFITKLFGNTHMKQKNI